METQEPNLRLGSVDIFRGATIAGMITSVTRKTTRRGDIWAVISVEDLEASVEVLLFPKAYEQVATVLAPDTVVKLKPRKL